MKKQLLVPRLISVSLFISSLLLNFSSFRKASLFTLVLKMYFISFVDDGHMLFKEICLFRNLTNLGQMIAKYLSEIEFNVKRLSWPEEDIFPKQNRGLNPVRLKLRQQLD